MQPSSELWRDEELTTIQCLHSLKLELELLIVITYGSGRVRGGVSLSTGGSWYLIFTGCLLLFVLFLVHVSFVWVNHKLKRYLYALLFIRFTCYFQSKNDVYIIIMIIIIIIYYCIAALHLFKVDINTRTWLETRWLWENLQEPCDIRRWVLPIHHWPSHSLPLVSCPSV